MNSGEKPEETNSSEISPPTDEFLAILKEMKEQNNKLQIILKGLEIRLENISRKENELRKRDNQYRVWWSHLG